MRIDFNDFVWQVNFFCSTLGLKPYDEPGIAISKRLLTDKIKVYFIMCDILSVLIAEMLFVAFSFKNGEHFIEAITTLTYFGFGVVGIWKIMTIFKKKPQLNELVDKLHQLFPKTANEQTSMKTSVFLSRCTFVCVFYSSLNMMLTWSYNLSPLLQWLFLGAEQNLPYVMYIPWHWQDNWTYFLAYAIQVFAGYSSTAGQLMSDLLLIALATQLIMHYENISSSIADFDFEIGKNIEEKCEQQAREQRDSMLKELIIYHSSILRLSDILNDVFGVPVLINFLTSTMVICFVGFQMTIGVGGFNDMVKLFFFMNASLVQVYLICHIGQQLIDSSTKVAAAVFAHEWTNAHLKYKKMLTLIMARAQKPAYLRATSFVTVSRNSMAALMKLSYNFFALLQTMYAN